MTESVQIMQTLCGSILARGQMDIPVAGCCWAIIWKQGPCLLQVLRSMGRQANFKAHRRSAARKGIWPQRRLRLRARCRSTCIVAAVIQRPVRLLPRRLPQLFCTRPPLWGRRCAESPSSGRDFRSVLMAYLESYMELGSLKVMTSLMLASSEA